MGPNGISSFDAIWQGQHRRIFSAAIIVMIAAAVVWLPYEFWRLIMRPDQIWGRCIHPGAVDLHLRYTETRAWFAGIEVYGSMKFGCASYPPASYVMLWPFVGLLGWTETIYLWGLTSILALAALIYLIIRISYTANRIESAFIALIPLCMYASGATIGNGQLAIHCTSALAWGIYLVKHAKGVFGELSGAAIFIFALVKPSLIAPFFWIILFCMGSIRPAVIICIGYAAGTLLAAQFQEDSTLALLTKWIHESITISQDASEQVFNNFYLSVNNLHRWAQIAGLDQYAPFIALSVLVLLGLWILRQRKGDIWALMGVTAIVARVWTYHNWYDDLILIFALIALFRILRNEAGHDFWQPGAGILLCLMLIFLIAPGGHFILQGYVAKRLSIPPGGRLDDYPAFSDWTRPLENRHPKL